ncbi:cytidylate kinase family protein, partial [Frisingicoccus sp.]|uniref:cytidylate kinase family protein n=1 Tax=Frisingicoccus sp. TaxID=1918627 RepID=UPI00399B5A0E
MRKIITISREFGAYGGTIGLKVSEKLGYEFYNKEIILQAAKYSNVDMDSLQ